MKKHMKKFRKTKIYIFIKNLKNILVLTFLISVNLNVLAQSKLDLNKEKYFKLEINQYDYSVVNSYPQKVLNIKNKKNKSIIKLKTHGTLNEKKKDMINDCKYVEKYLQCSDLIDYNTTNIKDVFSKLNLSSMSEYHCAKSILIFITSVIKYDAELAKEISTGLSCGKKASWVLENKKGTCGEYTNLFIALMRLRGVPCKYVTGLYYSKNQTFFHAWAEFYDSNKGWIPVDPQGGVLGVSSNHIKLMEGLDYIDTNFDMAKCDFKIRDITK